MNAIIMAAGTSTRFAPLSYEKPKGLLEVKGEILIERQIRQLKEAGITDIIIVVGYKSRLFSYLEDKYDVRLVLNKDYNILKTHSYVLPTTGSKKMSLQKVLRKVITLHCTPQALQQNTAGTYGDISGKQRSRYRRISQALA